jgi:hypothetical protein
MTTPNLAKIERVDLREAWPNEARDFTPWLAENIAELGEALGMDLELQETEASVGGYSLDVLATDLNQNRPVIVENQLETTNHDHLGKLLTYAAGYDANIIVWLTREFRDEHRQALDWLNQRTREDTQFFGVVVELLKIDGSRPAPQFRTVATPNDWRKETAATIRGEKQVVSARGERYREFFQPLIDTLREKHKFTNVRKAQPQNWYSFSAGYGQRITYGANFTGQKQARVEAYIDDGNGERNVRLLEDLELHKEEIESALGETLDWQRLDNRRACRIALDRPGSIEDDADTMSEIQEWMVKNLLKFKQVFEPRLAELIQ